MNKHAVYLFSMLLYLAFGNSALADEASDREELRGLVGEYEKAIADANPSVLGPYLSEDFTGVMVTGEEVDGMQSLQAYWDKIQGLMGDGGKYTVEVEVAEPATIDGDLAYAFGTTKDQVVTGSGKQYDFTGYWTAVCRREGGSWKILRIHGSMDAVTNVFVKSAISGASTLSGIIGGVLGVLVATIVCVLFARRRSSATSAN
ncbi:YybH family protein [Aeoliella sp.]|uniref:YybH family protein n=1 Tax=Aeoliella sp. TaxID=2795800 RepID=UPI003CCB8DC6